MVRRPPHAHRVLVLTVGGVALLAACSSGSDAKHTSTTTRPPAAATVKAVAGLVNVASAGPLVQLSTPDRDGVLAAISTYARVATLTPLSRKPATDIAALFAAGAAPAPTAPERDALTDSGLPVATKSVKATLAPVNLTGLADASGAIDLVGATYDLTVTTAAKLGPITVHRSGELMFTRDGATWKILGFTLAVTRDGAGLGGPASTTTASSAP